MAKTNPIELASFDASDYLDSEEVIAEYLAVALKDPDPDAFLVAVSDVAKARGMTEVAANAGLGRESLYKALRPGAHPRFDTIRRLLIALGVRLEVVATAQRR
jgi:probable addiction module antidote protein